MAIVNGNRVSGTQLPKARQEWLARSIDTLAARFPRYDMRYEQVPGTPGQTYFPWYGRPDEEIMVCVHKGGALAETFHRHDFFFFNYALHNSYDTLSFTPDNLVTVQEGELYVGQPFTGYALRGNASEECTIVGVLIQKETFFNSFLSVASANDRLLRFFIDPLSRPDSDRFLLLHLDCDFPIEELLGFMICEYADEKPDTQALLKSYALLLIMHTARQFEREYPQDEPSGECGKMVSYLAANVGQVSLGQLAKQFGYHPNYLSTLFRKELGKSFSQVVLEQRMERAAVLLRGTSLSVEHIARTLGYNDTSNFHKAFSAYYGCTPRVFAREEKM